MTDPRQIRNSDYDFPLPDERIAQVPLSPRDAAKLLVWDRGKLMDLGVRDAPDAVAQWGEYRLVINEAKVIPARIFMPRPSGIGHFELFYLDAEGLSVEQAMASKGSIRSWCKVRPQKNGRTARFSSTSADCGLSELHPKTEFRCCSLAGPDPRPGLKSSPRWGGFPSHPTCAAPTPTRTATDTSLFLRGMRARWLLRPRACTGPQN